MPFGVVVYAYAITRYSVISMSTAHYPLRVVFGGTFDPIHLGHIQPLYKVSELLGVDKIELLPSQVPPHKSTTHTTAQHRLAMLQLACAESALLVVNDIELQLPPPSYTVNTLQALTAQSPHSALVLVMGVDAFNGLHRWHQWQRLFALCHIAVCQRPGYSMHLDVLLQEQFNRRVSTQKQHLTASKHGRIIVLDTPLAAVSSTQVRQSLQQNKPVQHCLPQAVQEYIQRHGLYAFH